MRAVSLVGFAFLLVVSSSSSAALLSLDSEYGPGSITRDTSSGLDWLDLQFTAGRSYIEVTAQLDNEFKGYRIPTIEEVEVLFLDAGVTLGIINNVGPGDPPFDAVSALLDLVDPLVRGGDVGASFAVNGSTRGSAGLRSRSYLATVYPPSSCCVSSAAAYPHWSTVGDQYADSIQAVWLVRPLTAVPEPETYATLGIGLGLMGWVCRRRKQVTNGRTRASSREPPANLPAKASPRPYTGTMLLSRNPTGDFLPPILRYRTAAALSMIAALSGCASIEKAQTDAKWKQVEEYAYQINAQRDAGRLTYVESVKLQVAKAESMGVADEYYYELAVYVLSAAKQVDAGTMSRVEYQRLVDAKNNEIGTRRAIEMAAQSYVVPPSAYTPARPVNTTCAVIGGILSCQSY